jgi:hypothetical protein
VPFHVANKKREDEQVLPASDRQLHIRQHVCVWREKERRYFVPFAILILSEAVENKAIRANWPDFMQPS